MARDLISQTGVQSDPDFLNGKIVDGVTLISEGINQDIIQLFQKVMNYAGLTANGNPDNEANGYQFLQALLYYARYNILSTTTTPGTVEKATTAERDAGTADKYIDAALLAGRTATETRTGIAELATTAEVQTGSDTSRIVTPAGLSARTATETRTGIAELANQTEANTGADDTRVLTALKAKTALPEWNGAWTNLTLNAGWSGTVRYKIMGDNTVHLQFIQIYRSSGSILEVLNLPNSIRPSNIVVGSGGANPGIGIFIFGLIWVKVNGDTYTFINSISGSPSRTFGTTPTGAVGLFDGYVVYTI